MVAAFWCAQPGWLVVVLATTAAATVHARGILRIRRPQQGADAGATETRPVRPALHSRAGMRVAAGLLAGTLAAVLGIALIRIGTSGALATLGVLAFVAATWATIALQRRADISLSGAGRGVLVTLRCLAWLLLLAMLVRPAWDWTVVDLQKPLLVALLDQSESMAIVDAETQRSRAEIANTQFDRARGAMERLNALYEVRLWGAGMNLGPLSSWSIKPDAPLSGLASALQEAGAMRSRHGAAPLIVLLVSDGAENVASAAELRRAAHELGSQRTALSTVGVGPAPGRTPLAEIQPLAVPARLGLRDRLNVAVAARVQGCAGTTIAVTLLWDSEIASAETVRIDRTDQRVTTAFDVAPPSAGLHRLTARVTLPASVGGATFETLASVDVHDERIRVLWLDGPPRTEAAFVTRELESEGQLNLTRRFLFTDSATRAQTDANPPAWSEYDVVVLGAIPPVLSETSLRDLGQAVTERGIGLLLCGGRRLFNDSDCGHAALAGVSPVKFVRDEFGLSAPVRFVPTEFGLRHPALTGAATATTAPASRLDERAVWLALPALGGAALLGQPQPAAEVLALDGAGRPLLVAQEVGRGRCLAAAWESTWPWALASDEGATLHRRFWRQMINWLANRRPQAWVLTDRSTYSATTLSSGPRRIQIRAGVSGLEAAGGTTAGDLREPRLTLTGNGKQIELRLEPRDGGWSAELPARGQTSEPLGPGDYTLEFRVRLVPAPASQPADDAATPADDARAALEARSTFSIVQTSPERTAPTANLSLLRAAAEETRGEGGGFCTIDELPGLLQRLSQTDRRQEVWIRRHYGPVEQEPGGLFTLLLVVLGIEWGVRRRCGLA